MNRHKVLVIPAWYPSEQNPIAGIFIKEQAKAASLYNNIVVLYSEGINHSMRGLCEIEDNTEDDLRTLRVRYRKSPLPKTSYFIYLWAMLRAFRKLVNEGFKPDVIHAHVYSAGVPAVLLGKIYGIPVVISEHFSGFLLRQVLGLERMKAKFAFGRASLVCPVSEDLKEHIKSYRIRARFRVVPNVVDTLLFSPNNNRPETVQGGRSHILLVALLTPSKGVPYLLEALTHLKERRNEFVLEIVGNGPNKAEYEELARELNLSSIVRFNGLKTKREVAEFMQRCDFFVLPSLVETFGVVLIEAMACGKPVIATDIAGPREIVTDEVGKLVPPGNSEALAEAIDYMLDHHREYDSKEIVTYIQSRYSYEAVGKEWERVYRELLGVNSDNE